MANVHVDYNQLQQTATRLKSGKEELESQLNQLKGLVDQLVGSGFQTDSASGKFQHSYEQWTNGAKQCMTGLENMSQFLNKAIQAHQELDSSLSSGQG